MPMRCTGKSRDLAVQIEPRRLAAIERRLGDVALFARKIQSREQSLGHCDLIARHEAVRLAYRSHDRERRVEKLSLHRGESLDGRDPQEQAHHTPKGRTRDESAKPADEKTKKGK